MKKFKLEMDVLTCKECPNFARVQHKEPLKLSQWGKVKYICRGLGNSYKYFDKKEKMFLECPLHDGE